MTLIETSQLLGSFGEFFGAIAVVVTLGYLTAQMRQNTRSLNSNNSNVVMQGLNEFNTTIFSDPELVRVYYAGVQDPNSLPEFERLQFAHMAASLLNFYRNLFHQYQDGTYTEARWIPHAREAKQIMNTPGFAFVRDDVSSTYDDLYEYLETLPGGETPLSLRHYPHAR